MKNENVHPLIASILAGLDEINELLSGSIPETAEKEEDQLKEEKTEPLPRVFPIPKGIILEAMIGGICIVSPDGKSSLSREEIHGGSIRVIYAGDMDDKEGCLVDNEYYSFIETPKEKLKGGDVIITALEDEIPSFLNDVDNTDLSLVINEEPFNAAYWTIDSGVGRTKFDLESIVYFKAVRNADIGKY